MSIVFVSLGVVFLVLFMAVRFAVDFLAIRTRIAKYEAEIDRQERISRVVGERLAGKFPCDPDEMSSD